MACLNPLEQCDFALPQQVISIDLTRFLDVQGIRRLASSLCTALLYSSESQACQLCIQVYASRATCKDWTLQRNVRLTTPHNQSNIVLHKASNMPDHDLGARYLAVLNPQRADACEGCCDAPGCSDPASTQCHLGRCHSCVSVMCPACCALLTDYNWARATLLSSRILDLVHKVVRYKRAALTYAPQLQSTAAKSACGWTRRHAIIRV